MASNSHLRLNKEIGSPSLFGRRVFDKATQTEMKVAATEQSRQTGLGQKPSHTNSATPSNSNKRYRKGKKEIKKQIKQEVKKEIKKQIKKEMTKVKIIVWRIAIRLLTSILEEEGEEGK